MALDIQVISAVREVLVAIRFTVIFFILSQAS